MSEGPKSVDPETGQAVRFLGMRALCPDCLSLDVWLLSDPPLAVNRSRRVSSSGTLGGP